MKLANELNYTIERIKKLDREKVLAYMQAVKDSKDYNSFEVRIANDILRAVIPVDYICSWYDKYSVNDNHISTLAIKACKVLGYL